MTGLEQAPLRLRPMDYASVTLKDGKFKQQFDEMLEYFLAIPCDDILYGFRKRAGLPHPGNELGGWYCADQSWNLYDYRSDEIFHVFGQWLSFFGRAYHATGDRRIQEKAKYLLSEWGKTIRQDGYFFYSDRCNAWHYCYEKVSSGLVDLMVYGGLAEAETYLDRITGWAEKNLVRACLPADTENFLGMSPEGDYLDCEWYTLSEGLYRAYLATGKERYLQFAKVWHYTAYWDGLRRDDPGVMSGVHGYSHVNTLGGAAMAYRVNGEQKYLDTLTHAYELLKKYQLMATGGYAFEEHMSPPEGSNYKSVENIGKSFEVPCGSWAIFKAVRHLISITGEARYGEWAETALYNAIGAALPMKDDHQRRGKTFYYGDYRIGGGRKIYYECSFPCCSGTYPQAVTEYYNLIYYTDDQGVYITQYVPSVLDTVCGGRQVKLEIAGDYPVQDHFQVLIHSAGAYAVHLRAPSWLVPGEAEIRINGNAAPADIRPGQWISLEREWHCGDVIQVQFPMHLRTSPIQQDHPERAALMYGPVLLAAQGNHYNVDAKHDCLQAMESTKDGLTFTARNKEGEEMLFRPHWEYGEKEWNTVYLDFKG